MLVSVTHVSMSFLIFSFLRFSAFVTAESNVTFNLIVE